MNAVNYQKEFENIVSGFDSKKPTLLLHSCCAPCSSYCLVYLRKWFDITCYYYNPNITAADEYEKRVLELHRLVKELNESTLDIEKDEKGQYYLVERDNSYLDNTIEIKVIDGQYDSESFVQMVQKANLGKEPEGGIRCVACFNQRLGQAVKYANENDFDYVTTTLTISPLKNANWLNEIGQKKTLDYEGGSMWLPSDFKKKNGYKFSVELSERFDLYRQNYCGCIYSQNT